MKFIDFSMHQFPQVNPIDFKMPAYKFESKVVGEEVRLQNYRYPCADSVSRKGIVQFIHGHGDYAGRYAFMAKQLSDAGYDVVGLDRRGYGHSEGKRNFIENAMIQAEDTIAFTERVNEKFGGADVPHFSISNMMGATIQL